ncbi:hypothetical protein GCM10023194_05120 [Planotetraspora phitsanulokensis]|uniref:Carrier domain-containing protein n=1 Tax=Planotetraspora phitsanulokensis TaxID=575192 RepID=A0A8J3U641_9ACTN|nr:non-ribosomal peptide synthetase/MFS transporter [Planotetraspora phitsanulokensis]GII38732.1 hypothetical protein Pph01_37350 [Planotetraspora phitsanulokensis]
MTVEDSRRALAARRLRRRAATLTVPPRPPEEEPPLSFAQERLWFMEQYTPGSRAYVIPVARRFRRELDAERLADALRQVVERHETLRTRFPATADGAPALEVVPRGSADLTADLAVELAVAEAADEEAARALVDELQSRPFDLAAGPPIRALLVRLAPDDHVLGLAVHHIAADGWSVNILLGELMALYEGRPVPDLKVQYGDYALWQRGLPATGLDHWRERLAGVEALALPTDRPRPPEVTYGGASHPVRIDADLARRLRSLGEDHGASLYMVLLAGFSALLGRYAGQDDVAVGSPVAGRPAAELETLVGCFVNMLVMRSDLSGDPSFAELLLRVRETALDAFTHQDVPFEQLVSALNVTRDVSRSPLFQVILAVQNYEAGDGAAEGFDLKSWATRFDLELYFSDDGAELFGSVIYNTDLFDAATIDRLCRHLTTLLRAAVDDPGRPLSALELLDAGERTALDAWNDTGVDLGEPATLLDLVEAQVARTPGAPAVTFEGVTLSYAEIDERAEHVAATLRAHGVVPGSRVGVCAERSPELVAALLGVLKAGAAYVPLDPEYPADRLAFMAADGALSAVLTFGESEGLDALEGALTGCPLLPLDDAGESPPGESAWRAGPLDAAYVIYTSGSTGKPKGVPNTHRGIVNRLRWMQDRFGLTPGDVVLQKTPAGFDVSVWEFFWPLMTGARLVLARPGGHKDAAYLRDLIVAEGVTTVHFVPSMLAMFLAEEGVAACRTLERIVCSGEELPADLARRCVETLPAELHNLYGPTEAAVDVSAWHCTPEALHGLARVPIGAPVANTTLHVLGPGMRRVPVGMPGELHIGGAQVSLGYLGRPGLTAERFVPDPFGEPGSRLYRTGDQARWRPDGTLEFLGRLDTQVKLRGLRIELGEIEAVLREQPGVADAAVIVREDRPGDQRLVAYVVGSTPDRAVLKRVLPDYMVPTAFVELDVLPLSPNGKLDRGALPAPARPGPTSSGPPTTPTELAVAAIWTEILDLDQVGADDDFFDLGGHSLLATQLVTRLRRTAGVTGGAGVSVMDVFKNPTVRELAALIDTPADQRAPRGLLHELTPRRAAELSFVCVPYGGGSAVVYQPLADALPDRYSLWAVAIPGHDVGLDEEHLPFEELAARCVAEIQEKVRGPIALYGHCGVGSALIIDIARRLEQAGREVEIVYIGAMFPFARPKGRVATTLSKIARMEALRGDRGYANWLTGLGVDLSDLDPAQARSIIQNMREDSTAAEDYYTRLFDEGTDRLRAPIVTIAGGKDPTTDYYQERYREWHFLTDTSAVVVLEEAGHFFLKYRAAELAEIVTLPLLTEQPPARDTWHLHEVSRGDMTEGTVSHGRSTGPEPSMRRFAAVATGQLVSITGSALTEFAIPIWIYLTTGSVARFALFTVLGLVPGLVVAPLAGAIVDRYDRRKVMLGGDIGAGGVQLLVGLLAWTGNLQVWHLYPSIVFLSLALTFQRLAYGSAIPQLVPKRYLGHATGIGQLGGGLAQLLTPLLAVGLLSAVGLGGILVLDVASYVIAITLVVFVRFPTSMAWRRKESLTAEIANGFRYVWGNRDFRKMLAFFAVLNLPLSPLFLMISPLVLSFATLGEVGKVSFLSGLGVTLGGLAMSMWGGPRHLRMRGVLLSTLVLAVFCFVTGLRAELWVVAVGAFGMALWLTLLNGIYTTIVQVKVPQRLHGRVFALNTMIAWSTLPVGFGLIAPYGTALFEPLLAPGGALAPTVGAVIGTGEGRGIGFMYLLFALLMAVIALVALRWLAGFDDRVPDAVADDLIGLESVSAANANATAETAARGGASRPVSRPSDASLVSVRSRGER